MLYVERDGEGTIIAMHSSPQPNASEEKTVVDEEILDFLSKTVSADSRKLLLSLSDMGIVRLLEDLIDLLIHKNIIYYTELPEQGPGKNPGAQATSGDDHAPDPHGRRHYVSRSILIFESFPGSVSADPRYIPELRRGSAP